MNLAQSTVPFLFETRKKSALSLFGERSADNEQFELPLSQGQRALWFIHQNDKQSAAYNLAYPTRIRSTLNYAALDLAFAFVLERHPILRSRFRLKDGEPVQIFDQKTILKIDHKRVPTLREDQIKPMLYESSREPFDIEHDRLIRVTLYTIRDDDHVLLTTLHHIVSDFWSLGIVASDLWQAYEAFTQNVEPNLPPVKKTYAEYVEHQQRMLQGIEGEWHANFWKQKLPQPISPTLIPTDRARPGETSFSGRTLSTVLGEDLCRSVRTVSKEHRVTPFAYLLTAFICTLRRFTNRKDILIGTPTSGRDLADFRNNAIGFFSNIVPISTQVDDSSFEATLALVKNAVAEASQHQTYPYLALTEALREDKILGRGPLIQTVFSYLKFSHIEKVGGKFIVIPQQENQFDFALEASDRDMNIELLYKYNETLFDEGTIRRFSECFETLLRSSLGNSRRNILELDLLPAREKERMLELFNQTEADFPDRRLMHQLFEEQAKVRATTPAVICGKERVTYGELNNRANHIAKILRAKGVKPETVVGVYMNRSVEMVTAVLAVLKAGGMYLPIDPEYPASRAAFLLKDAEAKVLLTQTVFLDGLEFSGDIIDFSEMGAFTGTAQNLEAIAKGNNSAYVIYTSGSTGRPKGVVIDHRGAVNTLWDVNHRFHVGPRDRVLGLSSLSFDLSVFDIFGTLAAGAALVIVKNEGRRDPLHWLRLVQTEGVTVWNSVPALMQLLVDEAEHSGQGLGSSLRLVMMSGDWIPVSLPDRIRALRPEVEVISMGGATEASIWSIIYPIGKVESTWASIPYGVPMVNQKYFVLNEKLEPCPVGVAGDLYIGGIGLARCYLKDPAKTKTSFIFHPKTQERLYRTGDLGRHLLSGVIEFLGREDFQVKVQGNRIELGEIESALLQCAGVRQAVLSVRGDRGQSQVLCAYVVGQNLSIKTLRDQLLATLPSYMIPAHFVFLNELPLNSNGKVDRSALPEPSAEADMLAAATSEGPQDEIERGLTEIWESVLDVEGIGRNDDFFQLGGHSLKAVRVATLARRKFEVEIPLVEVFSRPTISRLSEAIRGALAKVHAATADVQAAN